MTMHVRRTAIHGGAWHCTGDTWHYTGGTWANFRFAFKMVKGDKISYAKLAWAMV
ncbi:MAG: hypothetical protein LBS42_11545 [Tannerella sp.]|nr:hypothetical protein [Tannerella sp.]